MRSAYPTNCTGIPFALKDTEGLSGTRTSLDPMGPCISAKRGIKRLAVGNRGRSPFALPVLGKSKLI
jgi:hypothetical protein